FASVHRQTTRSRGPRRRRSAGIASRRLQNRITTHDRSDTILSTLWRVANVLPSSLEFLLLGNKGAPLEFRLQAVRRLRVPSNSRDARPAKAGTPTLARS